jgi:hypothetical protein
MEEKMKKSVWFLSFLVCITVLLSAGGGGQQAQSTGNTNAIPSYINLDGYLPVVKQGTNITMTLSWQPEQNTNIHNDPAQMWWFRFVKEAMNINLNVTPRAPGPETKNLMFASGDLPDIWMGGISDNDITNYGVEEKLIAPITQYVNPVLMPLLSKLYSGQPALKQASVAPDGNIYGFSVIRSLEVLHGPITGGISKSYYNTKFLDQLGIKMPETLNDYLNLQRAFKSLGNDILPDAGAFKISNNFPIIFSALGFHWTTPNGITGVGTRNGKATFVYGDRDIYPKFVETYKTMYDEGLITRDFFTMDNNTRNAITMAGKGATLPQAPNVLTAAQFQFDYVAAKPLLSEYNRNLFWVGPSNVLMPNVIVITSKCKYPEVVCRLFDYSYDETNYMLMIHGFPASNPAYNYGMLPGWTIGLNDSAVNLNHPAAQYESSIIFALSRIRPFSNMPGLQGQYGIIAQKMLGMNPAPEAFNPKEADSFGRMTVYENVSPYTVIEFPFNVYWDTATSRRLSDLSSVINDYAQIQFAQFVSGARPMSEMNAYFAELDRLNYQEYLKYFVDYYEKVKAVK